MLQFLLRFLLPSWMTPHFALAPFAPLAWSILLLISLIQNNVDCYLIWSNECQQQSPGWRYPIQLHAWWRPFVASNCFIIRVLYWRSHNSSKCKLLHISKKIIFHQDNNFFLNSMNGSANAISTHAAEVVYLFCILFYLVLMEKQRMGRIRCRIHHQFVFQQWRGCLSYHFHFLH